MTTAIAKADFNDEQVALIRNTICKGASPDEFALFLGQCKRTGLDPFSKQIHAVKRWDAKAQRETMSIQVGIDGFRLIADRTEQTDGQDGPYWCDDNGTWLDVWPNKERQPVAAKVTVYRKGQSRGYVGIAHWSEYCQTYKDKQGNQCVSPMWAKMPALMLAKCAECLALRKAFPQELSGLYSPEEMAQASPVNHAEVVEDEQSRPPQTNTTTTNGTATAGNGKTTGHSSTDGQPADKAIVDMLEAAYRECKSYDEILMINNGLAKQNLGKLSKQGRDYMKGVVSEMLKKYPKGQPATTPAVDDHSQGEFIDESTGQPEEISF